jgi:hypothetical protein
MSDPRRLLEEPKSSFGTTLLRSARADAPSSHNRRRIAAALGVGGLFGASTVASGASATARGWLGTAAASTAKVAGGALAGALAVYGGVQAFDTSTPPAPPAVVAPAAATHQNAAPARVAPAAPSEQEPAATPPPAAPHTAASRERTTDTLSSELAALDRVRKSLAAGDGPGALRGLDDYERGFPKRRLTTEATVLRIESLAKTGDAEAMTSRAKQFLATHPSGPYATRVASLIGERSPNP